MLSYLSRSTIPVGVPTASAADTDESPVELKISVVRRGQKVYVSSIKSHIGDVQDNQTLSESEQDVFENDTPPIRPGDGAIIVLPDSLNPNPIEPQKSRMTIYSDKDELSLT